MSSSSPALTTPPRAIELDGPGQRLRSTFKLMRRPFETYETWHQKYGDTFLIKALNGDVVATCNTENIRRVFAAKHDEVKQFAIDTTKPLIGENSVIIVDGQRHKRARNLLTPPFRGEALKNSITIMQDIAERVTKNWQPGQRVRMMDASLDFSLEVIIQVVFGVQNLEKVYQFKSAIKSYVKSFKPIFAFTQLFQKRWIPAWNRFLKQKALFDQLLQEQIDLERSSPQPGGILSMLLNARDDEDRKLTDSELKDHLTTLLFAGHETTQIAIAWAMSWLHRDVELLEKVKVELLRCQSTEELLRNELLEGVCMEALRLNPIVPDFLRVFKVPLELEEGWLPANSTVAILSCRVHMDPSIYANPDRFAPNRWAGCNYKPYEFLAFGGGVRRCIGATMAVMEMKVALANWLGRYEFSLPADAPAVEPVHRRNLTMAPSSGIELIIR